MILIYSPFPLNENQIHNQMELFKDKLSMFFVDDNSFIYSSETNQKLLREIIINHKVFLFYTHSIKQMGFTPTQISELIIFLLKNGCEFQSELENLYFKKSDLDTIYPKIFEIFRDKTNSFQK